MGHVRGAEVVWYAHRTRRGFIAGLAAIPLVAGFGHLAAAQDGTPASSAGLPAELPGGGTAADGTWSFTDDRGVMSTLPATPTRVVAHLGIAAALYDYGVTVTGYYGSGYNEDGSPKIEAGSLPLDEIPNVGETGEIDVERLVELGTEVFVGPNYELGGAQTIWPVDEEALAQIAEFAQIIAFAYSDGTDVQRTADSIANLAEALGADLSLPEIVAAREEFEAALAELEAALAAKDGLTVAFISGRESGFWHTHTNADIVMYERLGMTVVPPAGTGEQSWESFGAIPADLLMFDDRPPSWLPVEDLIEIAPTVGLHPAVVAGQTASWPSVYVASHKSFTPVIRSVTEAVTNASPDIVE